ncbi:MAG TPA: transporter substrate-binding domain-containing protein, partial [Acidobacteria bacterium]|nr:transporter substrate-binding domain-containing protein [Acidobacteriota bacterium]
LITYTVLALVLSFLVLPALISAVTPFSHRDVLSTFRATLLTIFATGKIIVVLPQLIDDVKRLFGRRGIEDPEVDSAADILMPLAYPFPNLGTLVIMMFVPFSAWYLGLTLSPPQTAVFLGAGMVSSFVAPIVGIPFLLDLVHIPADMFELFVVSTVYTDRIRVVLGAMHLVALTVIATAILTGRFKLKVHAFARAAVATAVVFVVSTVGVRTWLAHSLEGAYKGDRTFVQMELLEKPVPTHLFRKETPPPLEHTPGVSRLAEIRQRGFLRVGYLADRLPFAFVNQEAQLVGFDVEMANELARDLGVRLQFVRLDPATLAQSLSDGSCDLLMSGLVVTPERALQMSLTRPYLELTAAFIVPDPKRGTFSSLAKVREIPDLRIGVVASLPSITRAIRQVLPNATIVPLPSPRPYLKGKVKDIDALLYSAEAGSAWTLLYPSFSVAIPHPLASRVPLAYAVAGRDLQLTDFLNQWIELKRTDGTIDRFYRHWILGEGAEKSGPRWSVLRNVLHVGEERRK